jgi:hypothetical protein
MTSTDNWLKASKAAERIGVSDDTIARRGIPAADDTPYTPYKIRYRLLQLDGNSAGERRYYEPDVLAMLRNPPPRSRGPQLAPTFT